VNIDHYISSGIIESYVLGIAEEDERKEFEQLCRLYPQLIEERNKFELELEHYLLAHAEKHIAAMNAAIMRKLDAEFNKPRHIPAFDLKEYILSGIVESYVLGLTSDEEKIEFESLCTIYPELVEERNRFEQMLEESALANAHPAPAYVGTNIFQQVGIAPASPPETIALKPKNNNASIKLVRFLVAACLVMLVGFGYFFYQLQVQNNNLADKNRQLQAKVSGADSILNSLVNAKKVLNNNNLSLVEMKGNGAPVAGANIYWDSASAAVYMVVRDLAPLPPGKQYQLWALIGGKPKSLGVFDATGSRVILKMRDCKNAEAFSITIEGQGGAATPSNSRVQLSGTTKNL